MENQRQSRNASGPAASKKKQGSKAPESEGYDKKLDGPNRPSI
ncbi:spore protein [Paenibacillus glycinis]|uniref:Spore protein n=1 Tax=Paenibacillus glycinis TaxID=2697035 RepID=A0ABW9XMB1_9BACL|nr:spore protein [Paenibacillus glycinis]NBD23770.1 spore protein [Paenibacillus glycinis]